MYCVEKRRKECLGGWGVIPAYDFGPVGEGVTFLPKGKRGRGHVPGPKLHDSPDSYATFLRTEPDCRGLAGFYSWSTKLGRP